MKKVITLVLVVAVVTPMLWAQTVIPKTTHGGIINKKSKTVKEAKLETYNIACPVKMDTWVYAFRPDSNYGKGYGWKDLTDPTKDITVPKMFLGFGGADKKAILLQFDLSQLPKGKKALKAVVKLYNDYAGSAAETRVDIKMVKQPWDEMKVTWKNKPSWTTAVVSSAILNGSIGYSQPGRWYEWDVAKMIHIWMFSNKPNYGIALDPQGDSGVDRDFICREYQGKEQFFPVLEVTYEKEAPKIIANEKDTLTAVKKKIDAPVKK